jgi:hypothetical protein
VGQLAPRSTAHPDRAPRPRHPGKCWSKYDLAALGWRHRRHYDMRATFITLAIDDGADPDVLGNDLIEAR